MKALDTIRNTRLNVLLALLTVAQTVLAVLVFDRFAFEAQSKQSQEERGTMYAEEDHPQLWPIPKRPQVLLFHEPYIIHYGLDEDLDWAALTPGNGTIYLGPEKRPYSISMFHQLRCIDIIRKSIVHRANPGDLGLTKHCFGYLRQMMLCRADMYADAEGLADYMVCEDWQAVYSEVEKNQRQVLGADITFLFMEP